jgi:putative sterol carrier protein
MDLPARTQARRAMVGGTIGLNAILEFDREADCSVANTPEKLSALPTARLKPTTGFMMGSFKVGGDISVALKPQGVI